ncbi:unnamed protein product [Zymoseptoria tritici ST99CH_1E4]|uniref:F-box domain-containing protein n=1 Tax=Zymoseptoria tritici ST99CH_1E4 TaxID=1276532 RepID=A0A2H1GHX3_ZYMTR|nr:unnamed protein product [Zymoseptoria tritici ST99CH_1E4]
MLDQLPEELLELCAESCSRFALKTLRRLCKTTKSSATKRLFSQVILKYERESALGCLAIMDDRNLRELVTTVTIRTSEPENRVAGVYRDQKRGGSQPEFDQCCKSLGKFANLRRLEVRHDEDCAQPPMHRWMPESAETIEFRDHVLSNVFFGLRSVLHPATKFEDLSIYNLQDMYLEDLQEGYGFKPIMKQLKRLALHIATEDPERIWLFWPNRLPADATVQPRSMVPMLQDYFLEDLRVQWLDTTASSLTSLALYADTYWGVYPACPLAVTHFPHLTDLALGKYTFAHDKQLDWVFNHRKTLRSLTLDDCPIVHEWYMEGGYGEFQPLVFDEDMARPQREHRKYETRWHDYFALIKDNLPGLRHFAMGEIHYPRDMSELAMAKRHKLGTFCSEQCYRVFVQGEFKDAWYHDDGTGLPLEDQPMLYDECGPEDGRWRPEYPNCYEEDMKALKELVDVVRARRRPRV